MRILLCILAVVLAVAVTVFGFAIRRAQTEAVRMRVYGRLSQLRLALEIYEYTHGSLPPREQSDGSGRRTFNWLVAILPYMEQSDLQGALDLSAHWDSPQNIKVAQSDVFFRDFIERDGYIAVPFNGPESIWNQRTGLPIGNLSEHADAIVLIAAQLDDITPLQPVSLTMDELRFLAASGRESFFIRSDGEYGRVTLVNDKVEFAGPYSRTNDK